MDCHADKSACNDNKKASILESTFSKEAMLCVLCLQFSKVDSRILALFVWIATRAKLARNDKKADFSHSACLSSLQILGFAVLLVGLFVDFRAELDLRSAVALKQGTPLGVSRCFFRKSAKSPL